MADDEWGKNPAVGARVVRGDEDQDDENVKDNWFDEDEEEEDSGSAAAPTTTTTTTAPTKVKKSKKLSEKVAQKEREELERKIAQANLNRTPEEIAAEKIRLEKLKEAAEIRGIVEAFGSTEINTSDPQTKDDFDELRKRLVGDLNRLEKRTLFPDFLEDLIQDLCLSLPARRLKKVKTSVEALYFEKSKTEKAATTKASAKASVKGKVKLNVEGDRAILSAYPDDVDEFEDFM